MPRLSVILPTHNRPVLLAEALASLHAQTYADWAAWVVDDASDPAVSAVWDDARIQTLRHDRAEGGAAAKNSGIRAAQSEILAFLDDDDCYAPTYLARALDVLDRHPELDVVFMGVSWFGSKGAWGQANYDQAMASFLAQANGEVQADGLICFGDALLPALLKSVPMAFQRPVVRKAALDRIGLYRPDCLLWDCDWAIQAALHARVALIPEGLYRQRAEGQGYSSQRDRTIEHLQSGIDIKARLLKHNQTGHSPQRRALFRRAAADAWFDLAWHQYQQGRSHLAWRPLVRSAGLHTGLRHAKFLARLLLGKP